MKSLLFSGFIFLFLASCGTQKDGSPRIPEREVPVAINIGMSGSARVNFVNLDYFRLRLLDDLEDFQSVNFTLAEEDEDPEITLNINIDNFLIWPRDERRSRRRISRNVPVGTDSNGKTVYQTVTAVVDIVQVQRRSNALFNTELTIGGKQPFNFKKTFSSNYNYISSYIDNIQGDQRAIDASLSMARGGMGFEPVEDDFLLILARQEMLRRLSNEIRKYYNAQAKNQN